METLKQVLIDQGYSVTEADEMIEDAKERVFNGENPEDILLEDFGLEPDYIFDIIP